MKKLAILLTIALLLGLFAGCQASQSAQASEESTEVVLGIEEEKIYCTATLEDEFVDNHIMVVITNIASLTYKDKNYTPKDFPEIQCTEVNDLTSSSPDKPYHKVLCLTIENAGKQNVLDAIKELEKREDVLSANPDFLMSLY